MKIQYIFVNAAVCAAAFVASAAAQSHLEIKVHTGHGANCSPKIKVDAIESKPSASPKGLLSNFGI